MADESQQHSRRAIRQLLLTAFSAEELHDLFYFSKTPELREVPNQFAPGDSYPTMVRKAVRYCDSRYLLGELLAEVQEANPRAYEKFGGTLHAKPAAAAPSQARPKWPVPALAAGAAVIMIVVMVLLVIGLKSCGNGTPTTIDATPPTETLTPTSTQTKTPTSTGTPTATDTPEPTTFTPASTTAPLSAPTLTPLPEGKREFIVVNSGTGGVLIRREPSVYSDSVATVQVRDRMEVIGAPEKSAGIRWWGVRTVAGVEGWVAEWWDTYRQVKPVVWVDDKVRVVIPGGEGDLYPIDDCDPGGKWTVSAWTEDSEWTEFAVIAGPDSKLCALSNEQIEAGVQFWWVQEVPQGPMGWIADFSVDDRGIYVKPMQIAPLWYAELTEYD